MGEGSRSVLVGVTNGTNVYADVTTLGAEVLVRLSAPYQMLDPPGFPFRPSFTGSAIAQYPHTLPSGTVVTLLACEANALIAAGGANLSS